MGNWLKFLLAFNVLSPVTRPLIRFLVGMIAIPLFRVCFRRMVNFEALDKELTKDLEEWFRGALLLLVATANLEDAMFGWVQIDHDWLRLGMRLLLAIGVIEAMPDQDLFTIIHATSDQLRFPKGRRLSAAREQCWPFCKGLLCRHLDRSSAVFAILSVIFTGIEGWIFYGLAIVQYLIIGLVSSRDKALDVLSEFDRRVLLRRQALETGTESSAVPPPEPEMVSQAIRPETS